MRKRIADMSLEEAQDEMVFSTIERLLKRAKDAATKAQAAEYSLLKRWMIRVLILIMCLHRQKTRTIYTKRYVAFCNMTSILYPEL